jgi:O-succinylbenzoic acid--CoA ligase
MYKDIEFSPGVSNELRGEIEDFISKWESPIEFIEAQTSGSTGAPKLIRIPKRDMQISAEATNSFFGLNHKSVLLLSLSVGNIAGKMMVVRAITGKARLIVSALSSNPLSENLSKVDFAAFVPLQVSNMLADPISRQRFSKIGTVIIGGAQISQLLEEDLQKLPNRNFATFGMTETVSHFAVRNISSGEKHFTCLPGFSISTDSEQKLVLDKHPFSSEKIRTNDIVELLGPNQFRWLGRADNIINSGGIKIHPETLEKKLEPLFGDRPFYISSQKHLSLGEQVVLIVEGALENSEALLNGAKKLLEKYQAPAKLISINRFQRTPTGKVIRQKF